MDTTHGRTTVAARLDLIGLVVEDIPRSLAFYRLLGIEVDDPAEGQDHVDVTLPSGIRMAWDTDELIRSFEPHWEPPSGSPRTGLAFLCGSPAEVDATYAALERAGYPGRKAPWDAFWGQRYALAQDPDGNAIDLFAPLEGD